MWQTDLSSSGKVLLLGDEVRTFESESGEVHEVVLTGLQPGKRYRYRVEMGDDASEGEFATAPESGAPFSFVAYGDSRSNPNAHKRVVERIRREVPDFILATGDMVNEGSSSDDWQEFFDVERDLLRENVIYPSLGNHDRQGRGRTADNYRQFFSLPENSPDSERYYAFTYGSARFLVLDSNLYSFALTDQTEWIKRQLQAARLDREIRHIFVSMHHPPYSISLHGGQTELREAWTPLFEKYQVDAVFSGHDHVYSRAFRNGVHYFVTGGGGAPLYGRKKRSKSIDLDATKFFERVNHHLRIHVVGDHVEVTAVRADGTIIETTSWGEYPDLVADKLSTRQAATERASAAGGGEPPKLREAGPTEQPTSQGFGLLGLLGAVLTIGAGGVMVWALRS
jgi:predicted MPP superfamily phosphohydrolase